ncbi:hypothetical protein Bxe_B0767 [Paraburkholderia xenovorans LB400]|uniref:Uncharacterized protein n=1 Tax=Paraburkholderia xenovorans (strain LB400) TaxID=266265 RepID=Q13L52_PARXL|nr:hypothetical protein Bxe_B0767 [Paraburkholderia xenovorans LB400]
MPARASGRPFRDEDAAVSNRQATAAQQGRQEPKPGCWRPFFASSNGNGSAASGERSACEWQRAARTRGAGIAEARTKKNQPQASRPWLVFNCVLLQQSVKSD